ncbi:MAG TPA: hypothetical protein DCZ93_09965 [Elusimicrobia bacterium]|nr:hypothetical protein [Elusimicrobiota bacterium]
MRRNLVVFVILGSIGPLSADTYNNISLQGQLTQPTPIYGVAVRVVSGGAIVGTGTDIDLLPDADMVFSTQTYITNPWVFRSGEDYILRLSSPSSGVILATFTITAAPFAHTVRGNADTGTQNIFAAYGNAGVGTASPQYRLVVSSGGSDLMWVASDGVHATKFTGDGSGLTNLTGVGDNLGNHIVTQTLDVGNYALNSSSAITAAYYQIGGSTVLAKIPGEYSFAVGNDAGKVSVGDYNTFVGNSVGTNNTAGHRNTFLGSMAGDYNTTGNYNTFIGMNAGAFNTTGAYNTVVGMAAGTANGGANVNIGAYAGSITTGSGNVLVGYSAGKFLGAFAYSNTFLGDDAGGSSTSGFGNVFIGGAAGGENNGDSNIVIGSNQDLSSPSASGELNIGGVLFGNLSVRTIGISTRAPQAALDVVSTGTASNIYAQIWRNGSGVVVASMTSQGTLYATLPNAGDDLGNHTATQAMNMADNQILNISSLTVTGKDPSGYSLSLSSGIYMPNGTVSAAMLNGNGSGITSLNATNLTNGTVADARLSSNVSLLSANQALSGEKTFTGKVTLPTRDKLAFSNEIHNSSTTTFGSYITMSTTQSNFAVCQATYSITTYGNSRVRAEYMGLTSATVANVNLSMLIRFNGKDFMSANQSMWQHDITPAGQNRPVYLYGVSDVLPAGTHYACLSLRVNGGGTMATSGQFTLMELR